MPSKFTQISTSSWLKLTSLTDQKLSLTSWISIAGYPRLYTDFAANNDYSGRSLMNMYNYAREEEENYA